MSGLNHNFSLPEMIKFQAQILNYKGINSCYRIEHGLEVFIIYSEETAGETIMPEFTISFTKHSHSFFAMISSQYTHQNGFQDKRLVCKNIQECIKQIKSIMETKSLVAA